jgi:hypothetical protein
MFSVGSNIAGGSGGIFGGVDGGGRGFPIFGGSAAALTWAAMPESIKPNARIAAQRGVDKPVLHQADSYPS